MRRGMARRSRESEERGGESGESRRADASGRLGNVTGTSAATGLSDRPVGAALFADVRAAL